MNNPAAERETWGQPARPTPSRKEPSSMHHLFYREVTNSGN